MPSLSPSRIVDAIYDAFNECNASTVLVSDVRGNPRHFVVQSGQSSLDLWVYIWTLTHGGGIARPKDEFRIQLTGVRPPLQLNPEGKTVLIGYEPNTGCFAGFDLAKHRNFSTQSPSIQIPITALHNALQNGFSFFTKGNDEIAIGIRPDQFLAYCLHSELLHTQGANTDMVNLLTKAAALTEIPSHDIQQVSSERRRIISEISRLSRDTSFRRKVTIAYDRRCAVTRIQLRLIDAAHIVPVGIEGSSDEVVNGICLSPTYHRAYDQGLIYLDESLRMLIHPAKEKELIDLRLDGGLADFKAYLGKPIHLPADRRQWPALQFIVAANKIRKIK